MSDAPAAFPEGGWADGGLRDAGRHLPLAARVFISRRERLDRSSVAEVAPGRGARGRCGISRLLGKP